MVVRRVLVWKARRARNVSDASLAKVDANTVNAVDNSILGNRIYANSGLGIDLFPSGADANDAGDGDSGPNDGQNYPVLASVQTDGLQVHIVGTLNNLCPIADQGVSAPVAAAQDVSGHCHHIAALFRRARRGDERARLVRSLDDDHGPRQSADQPVAHREVKRKRRRSRRVLADDQSCAGEAISQLDVLGRIDMVNA